ncbi:MAG: acyltransferase [Caulobacteraceae bacterium]
MSGVYRPWWAERLVSALKRLIQIRIWGMDIAPSAWIHPTALIDRTWPKGIHIGPDCFIAEHAVVLTHDYVRGVYLHTRIGPRCRLGPRAIVMPGLTIGEDCLIAPGAVVTRDMPSLSIAAGNPAKIESRTERNPA